MSKKTLLAGRGAMSKQRSSTANFTKSVLCGSDAAPNGIIARRQVFPPTRARSRTIIRLRVSCFPAHSFPDARSGKYHQKFRELLDLQMHGQQLRTLAYQG